MPKKPTLALWLICAAATQGCALTGKVVSPQVSCPEPPQPPPALMTPPDFEQRVRAILFTPELSATPESGGSSPTPER